MYSYEWDPSTGGYVLNSTPLKFSMEPRPVYYKELDILGFDQYWNYARDDAFPYMWAEANHYWYRGRKVASTKGGSLYTAPTLIIHEEPEPDGRPLQFVDIPAMVEKNRSIMEGLVQETIKEIYNTYKSYRDKVDLFYVAFSGGKDSVVILDIVQRTLGHNDFFVMFGNTDMELPTTISLAKRIEQKCSDMGISYYEAKAKMSATESWKIFGPPARKVRWCCTVHKTAPVINKLCEVNQLTNIKTVMITGVRGDESISRSTYEKISVGKKIAGQYSFHPLLDWSSAEIYLYIYGRNLELNEAYKLGLNRVGCVMCPNSNDKHEYLKRCFFKDEVDQYCDIIVQTRENLSQEDRQRFLEIGAWKNRLSGRELKISEEERYRYTETKLYHIFDVPNLNDDWKIWYKTMGDILGETETEFSLEFRGISRKCLVKKEQNTSHIYIENDGRSKNSVEFIFLFKAVLVKSQYCIKCGVCVSECPRRNIKMEAEGVEISDNCIKCVACLKILSGCLYYNSIKGSKDMKNLKGVNRYLSIGVDAQWIKNYMDNHEFEPGNRKTDVMFSYLNDAGITEKKKVTRFGDFVMSRKLDGVSWELMLCNLVYAPPLKWYVTNIPFNEVYDEIRLSIDMVSDAPEKTVKKARGEFWNGIKVILDSTSEFRDIGFGEPTILETKTQTGIVQKKMKSILRTPWNNPDPLVILYSLYKFAEKCGDYYHFTLTRLMDTEIESDGISPVQIFGLDRETMEKLIKGLAVNYPEFIGASFTIDMDNISLRSDKTSSDVLELF